MKRSTAALLAFAIITCLTVRKASLFYWLMYEIGDDAANSLCIYRAKHFAQLYGCFSRWGFYHPGPAFFYVQGWGEWLFYDWWRLCPRPRNAQVLMQISLNVCFFVIALRTFMLWLSAGLRRGIFLALALTLAVFHFADDRENVFFSTWPAYPPVLLMLCLLTVGTAVAAGVGSELPLLIMAGGFLLHSHVAQPLFVVPLTLLAYAGLWQRCAATLSKTEPPPQSRWQRLTRWLGAAWRVWPRAHLLAVAGLIIFALPLLIDACRGSDSNLAAIWHHLHVHHGEHKKWLRSFFYFLQFGVYTFYAGTTRADFGYYDGPGMLAYLRTHSLILACWTGVALTVTWGMIRQVPLLLGRRRDAVSAPADSSSPAVADTRRFLAWAGIFSAVVLGLTLYWGTIQDGPMLYYNSFFNYGIYYFAALVAVASFCAWVPLRSSWGLTRPIPVATYLVPTCLVAIVYGGWDFPQQWKHPQTPAGMGPYYARLYQHVSELIADTSDPGTGQRPLPRFLIFTDGWQLATAVALELSRQGVPFLVPPQDKVIFGETHGYSSASTGALRDGVQVWRLHGPQATVGMPPPLPAVVLAPEGPLFLEVDTPMIDPIDPGNASAIDFRTVGNAPAYMISGWSGGEPWGTWNDGTEALLGFRPKPAEGAGVEMKVAVAPMLSPTSGLSAQRMEVFFNGEPLAATRRFDATANTEASVFTIPTALWNRCAERKYGCAVLRFKFPDAVSPAKMDPTGQSRDQRTLAFGFGSIRFVANGKTNVVERRNDLP